MFTFQLKFGSVMPLTLFALISATGLCSAAESTELVRRLPVQAESVANAGAVAATVAATADNSTAAKATSGVKQVGYYVPSAPGKAPSRPPAYGIGQGARMAYPPAPPSLVKAVFSPAAYPSIYPSAATNAPVYGPANPVPQAAMGMMQAAQGQATTQYPQAANGMRQLANRIPRSYPQAAQNAARVGYAPAGYPAGGVANVANYATMPAQYATPMGPTIDGVGGCEGGAMVGQPMMQMAPQMEMAAPMMGQPMDVQMQAPYTQAPYMEAPLDGGCAPQAPTGGGYETLWSEGGGGDWSGGYATNAIPGSAGQCRSLCGCDPCAPCAWLRADILFGWLSGYDTPALLNRSPAVGPIDDYSDDSTIYGGGKFGKDLRIGGRLTGGFWFDECRKWGFQADAFSLGNDDNDINIVSDGDPFIYRPFTNTAGGGSAADGQVIAYPGLAIGSFRASTTGRLVSASPALRWNINCCCDPCGGPATRLDLLAGYRYFQLREGFSSVEVLRPQDGSYAAGTSFTLRDNIDTQNDFHGFELGGVYMRQSGALTTEISAMAAFGEVERLYTLAGNTTLFVPGAVNETYPGGFLVRPEGIGTFTDSEFTVVPQFRLNMYYCVTQNVQLTLGYSFLYLDNVFRPGPLMSTAFDGGSLGVNPAAGVAGSGQPKNSTDNVYMNALSLGVTYNF